MRIVLILVMTAFLNSNGCKKKALSDVPSCIQQMIKDYENKPKQNPPAAIYQYDYNGGKVYYVNAPCCDQFNTVFDANCNVLCHPDGGLTGKGDSRCADFNNVKANELLIWKDIR